MSVFDREHVLDRAATWVKHDERFSRQCGCSFYPHFFQPMLRAGQVVSRTEIEEHLYDANAAVMSNVIDSAVSGLRKAVTNDSSSKPLIHTRRGHGYILEDRDA